MPPKPKENSRHQPDDIKFPVLILGIRGKIKVLGKENINWEICFSHFSPWFCNTQTQASLTAPPISPLHLCYPLAGFYLTTSVSSGLPLHPIPFPPTWSLTSTHSPGISCVPDIARAVLSCHTCAGMRLPARRSFTHADSVGRTPLPLTPSVFHSLILVEHQTLTGYRHCWASSPKPLTQCLLLTHLRFSQANKVTPGFMLPSPTLDF